MIKITDMAGSVKYVNCDLIERIESSPDTVLFLSNGRNIIVKDKPEELLAKIVEFKRLCLQQAQAQA